MTKINDGITVYSLTIEGAKGNYNLPVRFDITDGFLGIDQYDNDVLQDRVLLSPVQFSELLAFVKRQTKERAK